MYGNSSTGISYDTRSVNSGVLLVLNPSYSWLKPVAVPKLKIPVCPTIYPYWRVNTRVHTFPKSISSMWNVNSFVHCLKSDFVSIFYDDNHDATRASLHIYIYIYIYSAIVVIPFVSLEAIESFIVVILFHQRKFCIVWNWYISKILKSWKMFWAYSKW